MQLKLPGAPALRVGFIPCLFHGYSSSLLLLPLHPQIQIMSRTLSQSVHRHQRYGRVGQFSMFPEIGILKKKKMRVAAPDERTGASLGKT